MNNYWVSWFGPKAEFELHHPWWISGYRYQHDVDIGDEIEQPTICAAVKAESMPAAMELIYACYDIRPAVIEFRFCEERPDWWSPYSSRFPKADWMPPYPGDQDTSATPDGNQ